MMYYTNNKFCATSVRRLVCFNCLSHVFESCCMFNQVLCRRETFDFRCTENLTKTIELIF